MLKISTFYLIGNPKNVTCGHPYLRKLFPFLQQLGLNHQPPPVRTVPLNKCPLSPLGHTTLPNCPNIYTVHLLVTGSMVKALQNCQQLLWTKVPIWLFYGKKDLKMFWVVLLWPPGKLGLNFLALTKTFCSIWNQEPMCMKPLVLMKTTNTWTSKLKQCLMA